MKLAGIMLSITVNIIPDFTTVTVVLMTSGNAVKSI